MKSSNALDFTHYFEYDFSATGEPRPIVVVTFIHGEEEVDFLMLVDSGAHWTSLPPELSDSLGIDLKNIPLEKGHGVGGSFNFQRIENIEMHLDQDSIVFHGPVIVNHGIKGWNWGVLGRETFFENFKVGFRQRKLYHIYLAKEN